MSTVQESLPGPLAGTTTTSEAICPHCGGTAMRVWRRPVDRLSTWLRPTRRYRCQAFLCQWEGNVRVPRGTPQPPPASAGRSGHYGPPDDSRDSQSSLSRTFLLTMAFALAAGGFILIAAYTHWLEPGGFLVSAALPSFVDSPLS